MQGSNLRQSVFDFVNLVRSQGPKFGSDPDVLANLEKAAAFDVGTYFGATSAPIADDTWEARTIFLGSASISERIQVDVPWPVVVVGMYASLSVLTTGSSTTPTLNDIDATIDLNTQYYKTDANGNTTATNAAGSGTPSRDGNFVTLAALSTNNSQGGRLMAWRIAGRESRLGVTFRWKQGASVFKDTIVSLAFFVQRIKEGQGDMG